ncbi:hypothetical protein AAG906_013520 [Vitis piasezkii]
MQEYIVYMGAKPAGDFSASAIHIDMLQQVFGSSRASNSLVRSYKRSFNGFVAKLTEEEMQQMKGMDGVVSIFPNEKKQLHTTRSWDFVGFPQQVKRTSVESDIIIGVLDSGIWPESDSFDDEGFGPPPSKWIGTCQGFSNFTCNNTIGAVDNLGKKICIPKRFRRPRDTHCIHCSWGLVNMASLMGFGLGTARGVPSARIAVYKICWSDGCADADILAAFDDAIADGVDIISFSWVSINTFELNDMYPLIYGGDAPNTAAGFSGNRSRFCFPSTLNPNLVTGKIVLCDIETNGTGAFLAGAVGALMADTLPKDSSRSYPLPASHLSARDGSSIANYINSTSNPTASIFKSTEVSDALAPYVVSFSSRPDIAAPGVRILAAWPPIAPVSGVKGDNREVLYNIISGTSMSCPHASGAAAYIKSFNPTCRICIWCGQYRSCKGYRSWSTTNGTVWNLNYPSFALSSLTKESITGMFNRTVTNVGSSVSTYKATVIGAPEGLDIQVEPSILSFTSLMQKLSFVLKVEGKVGENIVSASLVWDDGVHQVRTPIVVLALT